MNTIITTRINKIFLTLSHDTMHFQTNTTAIVDESGTYIHDMSNFTFFPLVDTDPAYAHKDDYAYS